ncbi:hypothetical protein P8452_69348 [Trifolium repens]|nr:hypothetical protein P8452_69348 [Trifolium repens]
MANENNNIIEQSTKINNLPKVIPSRSSPILHTPPTKTFSQLPYPKPFFSPPNPRIHIPQSSPRFIHFRHCHYHSLPRQCRSHPTSPFPPSRLRIQRRKISTADRFLRRQLLFASWDFPLGSMLTGKKIGIVGMGRIGLEVA